MSNLQSHGRKYKGYKIVHATERDDEVLSIADHSFTIKLQKAYRCFPGAGLFLGLTKQYCLDYFSIAGEEGALPELLLTYEFREKDVINGDPTYQNGEVQVRWAKYLAKEKVEGK
jgi:hypothetical protein